MDKEASVSVIPLLLQTQDAFIAILKLVREKPEKTFEIITATGFPANLFLKHLVVLADFGGEQIQRLNSNFNLLFPNQNLSPHGFDYFWNGNKFSYHFKTLPIPSTLNNKKLGIEGKIISQKQGLDELKEDMIMILLFAASSTNEYTASLLSKCEIGNYLGRPDELEKYIKQKYIWVSRITGGAQANQLGQVAQEYVSDYLKNHLPSHYQVIPHGHISGVTQNMGRTNINFDIVVKGREKAAAVEVTFQVTTNSTIERKSGQAVSRYELVHSDGNFIAYVIDGAGNFIRRSAISTMCSNSDCTVAFSDEEFDVLCEFIKEKI
jgi:hypothetical protein